MVLKSRRRQVSAGVFKARCLALLDEVAATRCELVVTKRGRPVAKVVPLDEDVPPSLLGSIVKQRDIVGPIGVPWDADD